MMLPKFLKVFIISIFCFSFISVQAQRNSVQTLTYPHGRYVGEVANGMANGQGTYTAGRTGTVYSGQFVNDTFSGKGVMSWANGDKFIGTWQNDSATSGTMTFANGGTAYGVVRNGKFYDMGAQQTQAVTQSQPSVNNSTDGYGLARCAGTLFAASAAANSLRQTKNSDIFFSAANRYSDRAIALIGKDRSASIITARMNELNNMRQNQGADAFFNYLEANLARCKSM